MYVLLLCVYQVVSINFSPCYYNPVRDIERKDTDDIIALTCAEDVLSTNKSKKEVRAHTCVCVCTHMCATHICKYIIYKSTLYVQQFMKHINKVRDTLKFDFILISPMDKSVHKSTGKINMYYLL